MNDPASDAAARDPGLQPERTALAWQRTGLAAAAVCLILGLTAIRLDYPLIAVLAASIMLGTLLVVLRGFPRGRPRSDTSVPAWPALVRIVVVVLAIAAVGVLLTTGVLAA